MYPPPGTLLQDGKMNYWVVCSENERHHLGSYCVVNPFTGVISYYDTMTKPIKRIDWNEVMF